MGHFTRLRGHIKSPGSLTIWAKYAIYESIDKIPQIWYRDIYLCGAKGITVE
jgi:hypothetical protein